MSGRPTQFASKTGVGTPGLFLCSNEGVHVFQGALQLGSSGPNLEPGTVCVCGMNGLRKGMNNTQHPPSPASRAGTDLPTNVQAVSQAVSYVNTHRPRFQVRARPSY